MRGTLAHLERWIDGIDPGTHRRIKGLRLVTAFGIAAALGTLKDISADIPSSLSLATLAGSFALWASVSEGRATRYESTRDLIFLCLACALGATSYALLAPTLRHFGHAWPESVLVVGAFLVGYLKRYGITGAGIGSQIYIGQLLAYGAKLTPAGHACDRDSHCHCHDFGGGAALVEWAGRTAHPSITTGLDGHDTRSRREC